MAVLGAALVSDAKRELEIKLSGAPADVAAFVAAPFFRNLGATADGAERLVTTYYDDKGWLARRGMTLRLRESARGRLQTFKQERGLGAVDRLEDECWLNEGEDFPAKFGNRKARKRIRRGNLKPVLRSDFVRRRMDIRENESRIEAAVDFGGVETLGAGERRVRPVAEIEFELKSGRARDLFALARRCVIAGEGRLHVSFTSKSERPDSGKGTPRNQAPSFCADASLGDVVAAQGGAAALRLAALSGAVIGRRDARSLHRMRIELRRFRSLARACRRIDGAGRLRRAERMAGDLSRALGGAREWDVFMNATLPALSSLGVRRRGFRRFQERGEAIRVLRWDEAATSLAAPAFSLLLLELMELAGDSRWRSEKKSAFAARADKFAAAALDKKLTAARRRADALDDGSPDERHRLRIAIKRLRYTAQAFAPLFPRKKAKKYLAALARLQDDLGAANDGVRAGVLASEAARGAGAKTARAAGFVAGFYAAVGEARAQAAAAGWRDFDERTPFWRR